MNRRKFSTAIAIAAFGSSVTPPQNSWAKNRHTNFTQALRELETQSQGRLGVHVLDTGSGQEVGYRQDERFMMLSSFKALASALVLACADRGQESLERRIRYSKQDLVAWSPVTEKHLDDQGLSLAQLCEATITTSDNTAANLILASYGGPKALTAFARQLGDTVTRLDRNEPALNVRVGNAPLDTTSPRAMARTLQKLLLGTALSAASRQLLLQWLQANTTGGKRLKAGIPADWTIGDKTGTNRSSANDIGILLPPQGAPLLVTAYLADSTASPEHRETTLAEVGRLASTLRG